RHFISFLSIFFKILSRHSRLSPSTVRPVENIPTPSGAAEVIARVAPLTQLTSSVEQSDLRYSTASGRGRALNQGSDLQRLVATAHCTVGLAAPYIWKPI